MPRHRKTRAAGVAADQPSYVAPRRRSQTQIAVISPLEAPEEVTPTREAISKVLQEAVRARRHARDALQVALRAEEEALRVEKVASQALQAAPQTQKVASPVVQATSLPTTADPVAPIIPALVVPTPVAPAPVVPMSAPTAPSPLPETENMARKERWDHIVAAREALTSYMDARREQGIFGDGDAESTFSFLGLKKKRKSFERRQRQRLTRDQKAARAAEVAGDRKGNTRGDVRREGAGGEGK